MSVYKRPHGRYDYDFQIQGVRFCGSTGCTSERAAREFERTRKEQTRQELAAIKASRTGPMTVNVAFDRFWSEVGTHYTGTYRSTVWSSLRWIIAAVGKETLLRELGPSKVTEVVAMRRGEGVSNGTVNRTVTEILRRIFRRAEMEWEQEVPKIAWRRLLLPEPKERIRELREHEELQVFTSMRDDYRPALAFFLASGCRLREAVNLRWSDVDWGGRTITIHGKGDKKATIPLSAEIRAVIAPLRGHHPESVFTYQAKRTRPHPRSGKIQTKGTRYPITESGLKTTWRRYGGAKAGLIDFRLHDTRHTAATRLLRATGNLKLVQQLLRHEEITTTAKYAHANDTDLREAMDKVSAQTRNTRMRTADES